MRSLSFLKILLALFSFIISTSLFAQTYDLSISGFAVPPNAVTPYRQLEPIHFGLSITNNGTEPVTDIEVIVEIIDTSTQELVYSDSAFIPSIAIDSTLENFRLENTFFPKNINDDLFYSGTYKLNYSNSADDINPLDNTAFFQFEISENSFAKELGNLVGVKPSEDSWEVGEFKDWYFGNYYYLHVRDDDWDYYYLNSVEFVLGDVSNLAGQTFTVWLYEWEDQNNDGLSQEEERIIVAFNIITLTGNESNCTITISLLEFSSNSIEIPLKEETAYLVMLSQRAEDTDKIIPILASEDINYENMITLTNSIDNPRYATFSGFNLENPIFDSKGLGYNVIPAIRMNIQDFIPEYGFGGVDLDCPTIDNDSTTNNITLISTIMDISISPNPATHSLNITSKIQESHPSFLINIFSSDGTLVKKQRLDMLSTSEQNFSIDVHDLPNGIYFINVITQKGSETKRFIIQH